MEITWTIAPSPLGELLLAATPGGLVRVAFACEGFEDVLADLVHRAGGPVGTGDLAWARDQLHEYFAGERTRFDLPVDWGLTSGFRGRAQRALTEIPYGSTESYGDLARRLGNPGAVRAVGTACATNPLPVVVPCHRVLRSDGTLGGYRGGLEAKRYLLDLEAGSPRSSG